jgi:hypothetical protein
MQLRLRVFRLLQSISESCACLANWQPQLQYSHRPSLLVWPICVCALSMVMDTDEPSRQIEIQIRCHVVDL